MTVNTLKCFYVSFAVLLSTGLLFAIPFYFDLYFDLYMNFFPPRGGLMKIHGAASMVFLIVLGAIWQGHSRKKLKKKTNRVSGISMLVFFAVLSLTGYFLYYTGSELLREVSSIGHTLLGVLVAGIIIAHSRTAKKRKV